jgi:hypothetical protein
MTDLEYGLAASAEATPMDAQGSAHFDQGFDYNLDTSMSPEGRKEYGV